LIEKVNKCAWQAVQFCRNKFRLDQNRSGQTEFIWG